MTAEWRSTDAASSNDQTNPVSEECSGIASETDRESHSPRKRRPTCQPVDVDNHSQDKKRKNNRDLQSTKTIFEEQEVNLMRTEASPGDISHSRNTSSEFVQPHQKSEEKEDAQRTTFHKKKKTEIQTNYNIEILPTTELSIQAESLFKHLLEYPNLYHQDVDGDTLLHLAIVHKKVDLIRATILAMEKRKQEDTKTRGVNIQNKLRQTGLHLAVLTCQPSIVKFLLEHGADVNAIDHNGHTGLHLACKNADVENIRAMRIRKTTAEENNESSIDINLKNFEGLAPIHLATLTGSCEVIDELLDMGADINAKDSKSGRTALHHAVEAQNPIVTRMLLSRNADVNAQTFAGNTPLHAASGHRMENIIYILLEFEADRKLTNFEGDLPLPETYMPYAMIRKLTQKSKEKKQK